MPDCQEAQVQEEGQTARPADTISLEAGLLARAK